MLKGYICVMTFMEGIKEIAYECSEPYEKLQEAIDSALGKKDDKWDVTYRDKYSFYVLNLSTGKRKRLKGWKTKYSRKREDKMMKDLKENEMAYYEDKPEVEKIIKKHKWEQTDTYWSEPKKL